MSYSFCCLRINNKLFVVNMSNIESNEHHLRHVIVFLFNQKKKTLNLIKFLLRLANENELQPLLEEYDTQTPQMKKK